MTSSIPDTTHSTSGSLPLVRIREQPCTRVTALFTTHATIFGMSLGDLIPLALYLTQQLGVMLGVGAATVILISYLVSMRDGVVEAKEAQFARVVRRVLDVGLVCIILSGALITASHALSGEYSVIASPAYFFKWALIAVVGAAHYMRRTKPFFSSVGEGVVGATWYALFILHIVAPIAYWSDLLFLYAAWLAGFMLLWISLSQLVTARLPNTFKPAVAGIQASPVSVSNSKSPRPVASPPSTPAPRKAPTQAAAPPAVMQVSKKTASVSAPAPVSAPTQMPAKIAVPPKPPPPPAAPVPAKPKELTVVQTIPAPVPLKPALIKNTDDTDALPHLYVMPRTPEDVERHMRSAVV